MALSVDDVKGLLVSLLPPGATDLYALRNSDNIGGLFYGISKALKTYGTDRLDALRLELNPSTCNEKIPDWEAACGLTNTPIAKFGTPAQRRNAILSVLRAHSSFDLDDIRAAVQPYLLYADPSQIQIIETDRTALRALHTYNNLTPVFIGIGSSGSSTIQVLDDPRVSPAGAIVTVEVDAQVEEIAFRVQAPDGRQATFHPGYLGSGLVVNGIYTLWCPDLAGAAIRGNWTLTLFTGPVTAATLDSWSIFVEGLGVNFDHAGNRVGQGLGAAIYEFAVVADPAKLGTGYDLNAAYNAIQAIKPAHVIGTLVTLNGVTGLCAVPDEAQTIPDACIPC